MPGIQVLYGSLKLCPTSDESDQLLNLYLCPSLNFYMRYLKSNNLETFLINTECASYAIPP